MAQTPPEDLSSNPPLSVSELKLLESREYTFNTPNEGKFLQVP